MSDVIWKDGTTVGAGVVVARVEHVDPSGDVLIRLPGDGVARARRLESVPQKALETAAGSQAQVVCMLEDGDPARPIVVGILAEPGTAESAEPTTAVVDGKRVVLTGEEEVTLRCGKASITLTKAGKILLRGTYVLSRSSGVNRIKGGSVQIN
ncbi:MAG TPA: DUF6484 domain-containing protein [Acidobacteriota bacterium]|nr:DUF6484 domain-containing protein [Acidobacteriota bacterium]